MTTTKPPIAMLDLTATTGELPLLSADPTAAAGPILSLIRQSASPAASDLIGYIKFDGMDAAAVRQNYASILAQILDATVGSEDGALFFSTCVAGVDTVTMTMLNGRVGIGNSAPQAKLHVGAGADAPTAIASTTIAAYVSEAGATAAQVKNSADDIDVSIVAGSTSGSYNINGPDTIRHFFNVNGQAAGFFYDQASPGSGAGLVIGAAAYDLNSPQSVGMQVHSSPYISTNGSTSLPGSIAVTSGGAATPISVNRSQGDGELVGWYSGGSFVGNVTCAGGVVSYNAFSGSHWSQLQSQERAEILRGTIVESIDELCSWEGEDPDFAEHLPKFKVSDTAGSRAVYGVFMDWMHKRKAAGWDDTSEFTEDDALITSLGACMIRIDGSIGVERGDLIESAGNGCGRVQADDIVRSSTVAKVTANVKIGEYPDGSYLVPCTLHCG